MSRPFSWSEVSLPVAKPLKTAFEAGLFGVCGDGSLLPNAEEVAAITEEQARELLDTLCSIKHLDRCLARHLNPHTHQPLKSWEIRERVESSMKAGLANLHQNYEACLSAYEDAFGPIAAAALDDCVRRFLSHPEFALDRIEIQQSLF